MYQKELEVMIKASELAKEKILEIYHQNFEVEIKSDNSPVTQADKQSDLIIREKLNNEFPDYGFLTEESNDDLSRLNKEYIFVVDPVDGTKDFVSRNGQFTTNIALVRNHQVVVGVISIPCRNEIYYAIKNQGAYFIDSLKNVHKIHVNDKISSLTMLVSNFHKTKEEMDIASSHKDIITNVIGCGSSIKACLISKGEAEVSYRFGPNTKEWDTAASQIIVQEAGGVFAKPNLEEITYNRIDVYNREGFVILNRKENLYLK